MTADDRTAQRWWGVDLLATLISHGLPEPGVSDNDTAGDGDTVVLARSAGTGDSAARRCPPPPEAVHRGRRPESRKLRFLMIAADSRKRCRLTCESNTTGGRYR